VPWSGSQARCWRSVFLYWARAEERRGLKREYHFYTILEVLQRGGGSNMAQYMPFQTVQSFHKKPSTQPRSKVPPICSSFRVNVAENQ